MRPPDPSEDSPHRRVTIRDIAKKAGVHFTTVGLALRGSSQLSKTTRDRIRSIAEEMGYRPDPMLAALNVYRRSINTPRYQATLAWLNNWPDRHALQANAGFREYYEGARQRADQMGFILEEFWMKEPGLTPERLTSILRARNIEGLLLAPQPQSHVFPNLDYSGFAAVSFGYSLRPSVFHVVTNHHFHSMTMLLQHLHELGYQRIGLFIEEDWDEKVENGWLGGMALARWKNPDMIRIPPLLEKKTRNSDLERWLAKHKPDVMISHSDAERWLHQMGWKIPAQIGFASLSLAENEEHLSGLLQNNRRIGQAAVDYVISMLHSGERGIPSVPTRILVESLWNPGTTLRLRESSEATTQRKPGRKAP